MKQFPLKEYGQDSASALHTMIEAKKLSYTELTPYVADQRFSKVPVSEMISKSLSNRLSPFGAAPGKAILFHTQHVF